MSQPSPPEPGSRVPDSVLKRSRSQRRVSTEDLLRFLRSPHRRDSTSGEALNDFLSRIEKR